MRVLIINTAERIGGAAIAASRLMDALRNNGIKAKMLVRNKQTERVTVVSLKKSWWRIWQFLWERLVILTANRFSKHNLFAVDIANTGTDITSLPEFRQADVIHLHWINQGMLSLTDIRKILESGKPVVWTLHDMWPFTGICHYAGNCDKYKTQCQQCEQLLHPHRKDLSARVFHKKQKLFAHSHITFVACSRWLEAMARESSLLTGHTITNIPNAINTNLFRPRPKTTARERLHLPADKKLLLFGSMKITDERKGIAYLIEACQRCTERTRIQPPAGSRRAGKPFRTMCIPVPLPYLQHELCEQRKGTGGHLQRSRPLRDSFPAGQPAEHHRGSHGLRYSLRRIQCGRYSADDRPPAQRLCRPIQIG